MKITETSFVSMGLVVVLCGVAWRVSKIDDRAEAAVIQANALEARFNGLLTYISNRRDISDQRWQKIEKDVSDIRGDVRVLRESRHP